MRGLRPIFGLIQSGFLALILVVTTAVTAPAQTPPVAVAVGSPSAGWPLVVEFGPLLEDAGLRSALDSALPLRFHLRAELWRKQTLDRLVESQDLDVALLRDPLGDGFTIESEFGDRKVATLEAAQAVLAELLTPQLRTRTTGRHYYIVVLEVETLSLSDLDELRRWLRGDVGPAFGGQGSPARAIERGLRRLLVRVIGLPTRRVEVRTGTFTTG